MIRKLTVAAAALMLAGAAFAQTAAPEGSTIANVLSKGIILSAQGMEFPITYAPNGTYDAGAFSGAYKVDGKKLCMEIAEAGITLCSEYPDGKKSGDAFQITTDMGPIDVKIR